MRREKESWIQRNWRPAAAFTYLGICIFDFVIVPVWLGIHKTPLPELINAIKDLPLPIQTILVTPTPEWSPLTLMGGGLFHIAFGAILGAAAWVGGQENIEQMRQTGQTDRCNLVNPQTTPITPPPTQDRNYESSI